MIFLFLLNFQWMKAALFLDHNFVANEGNNSADLDVSKFKLFCLEEPRPVSLLIAKIFKHF